MQNNLNGTSENNSDHIYFLPSFNYDKEIKEGRHIRLFYESYLTTPSASQLMPVTDYLNSLSLYSGNIDLKPEYSHMLNLHYMLFDQFSFTSLFTNLNLTYTKDKINYAKTINEDLSESLTLINTPSDFGASISADFSTPIRPLKINSHLSLSENYDRGINYINDIENSIDAFTHSAEISFDNRKKQNWMSPSVRRLLIRRQNILFKQRRVEIILIVLYLQKAIILPPINGDFLLMLM